MTRDRLGDPPSAGRDAADEGPRDRLLRAVGLDWVASGGSRRRRVARALGWLALVALVRWAAVRWIGEVESGRQQDFLVYLQAARDLLDGLSPYTERAELPYTYPPAAAVLFMPLALLPTPLAIAVWVVLNCSLAVWIAGRLFPREPLWLLLLVLLGAPLARSVYLGQVNLVLFAAFLVDLVWARRRAGPLVGVAAAVKVTPAWLAATYLVRRDWPAAARAVGWGVGLTAAVWAMLPEESLAYWTRLLWDSSRVGSPDYADNQSVTGMLARLTPGVAPSGVLRVLASLAVVLLTLAAVRGVRDSGTRLELVTAVGLGGLLLSPISWSHHWIWLVAYLACLVRRSHRAAAVVLAAVLAVEPLFLDGPTTSWPTAARAVVLSSYTLIALGALVHLARLPNGRVARTT